MWYTAPLQLILPVKRKLLSEKQTKQSQIKSIQTFIRHAQDNIKSKTKQEIRVSNGHLEDITHPKSVVLEENLEGRQHS